MPLPSRRHVRQLMDRQVPCSARVDKTHLRCSLESIDGLERRSRICRVLLGGRAQDCADIQRNRAIWHRPAIRDAAVADQLRNITAIVAVGEVAFGIANVHQWEKVSSVLHLYRNSSRFFHVGDDYPSMSICHRPATEGSVRLLVERERLLLRTGTGRRSTRERQAEIANRS